MTPDVSKLLAQILGGEREADQPLPVDLMQRALDPYSVDYEQLDATLKQAIDEGLSSAQAYIDVEDMIHWLLLNPHPKANPMAMRLLERLGAAGYPSANFLLATALLAPEGQQNDCSRANALLAELLERSDMDERNRAQVALALAHSLSAGRAGVPEHGRALQLYEEASDLGSADAAFMAGHYHLGDLDGRAENVERAAHYLAQGMKGGSTLCGASLGILHVRGRLVSSDRQYGEDLLRAAAADGNPAASEELGRIRLEAEPVSSDSGGPRPVEVLHLYQRICTHVFADLYPGCTSADIEGHLIRQAQEYATDPQALAGWQASVERRVALIQNILKATMRGELAEPDLFEQVLVLVQTEPGRQLLHELRLVGNAQSGRPSAP